MNSAADPRSQAERDVTNALLSARNCLLYERDDGPALLNVGTPLKPLKIPHSEAWQLTYSMGMLTDCDGDHARIDAARKACAERQAGAEASIDREVWSRAVDLCDQALRMLEGIGAAGDDRARQILVAVCEYETGNTALGVIGGVAEDNARQLTDALREAGATMSDVPAPETLVNWAFPWL